MNMSKKRCQLRLGTDFVLNQITNVNDEVTLDAETSVTLVAHLINLVKYFLRRNNNPKKEAFFQNLDWNSLQHMNWIPFSWMNRSKILKPIFSIQRLDERLWVWSMQNFYAKQLLRTNRHTDYTETL